MNRLYEPVSGQALATMIRSTAAHLGKSLLEYAAPLSPTPCQWVSQLERSTAPKPATVARVRQLLSGEPVEPPPPNNFQASPRKEQVAHAIERSPVPTSLPVYRDPCWRCGVRADVGCEHSSLGVA
jgi:hypothetical protein